MSGHRVEPLLDAHGEARGLLFILDWDRNPLPANGGRGQIYSHARKVRNVREVTTALGQSRVLPGRRRLQLERAEVQLTWFVTTKRRRDADNLGPLAKALVDGLVSAGVIPDDNDDVVLRRMPRIVLQSASPAHFELQITTPGRNHP